MAVAHRRDRHDVRDRRRRLERACSGAARTASLLSLRDGIAKHFVAALATIEATAARARGARARLPRVPPARGGRRAAPARCAAWSSRRRATRGAPPSWRARCCAPASRCAAPAAPSPQRARTRTPTTPSATRRFDAGAYVVDLAQPQGKVAQGDPRADPRARPGVRAGAGRQVPAQPAPRPPRRSARATSSTTSPRGRCPSRSASTRTGPTTRAPSPASCSPSPPRSPRCRRRSSSRVASGASSSRWTSAAASSRDAERRRRICSAPSATARRGSRTSCSPRASASPWPRSRSTRAAASGRAAPTSCASRATTPRLAARLDALARASGVEVTGVNTAQAGDGTVRHRLRVDHRHPGTEHRGGRRRGCVADGYGAIWCTLERRYGMRFTPDRHLGARRRPLAFTAILFPSRPLCRACRRRRSSA